MVAVGVLLHPLPYIRAGQGKRGKVLREKTLPDDQPCNMVTCLLGLCEQEFCRIPWVGSALASVTLSNHQCTSLVFWSSAPTPLTAFPPWTHKYCPQVPSHKLPPLASISAPTPFL
jgi:hypothetical protein